MSRPMALKPDHIPGRDILPLLLERSEWVHEVEE